MNRLLAISAGLIALALPAVAQTQAYPSYRELVKPAAFQWQDRDDRWREGSRLSADDQRRFDSYYSRWQEYRRTNNGDEIRSMEGRMQDIYSHYGIPSDTPYDRIASNGGGYGGWGRDRDRDRDNDSDDRWGGRRSGNWGWGQNNQTRLSADDQRRFDSYYSRWLEYRRTNNGDEIRSMEGRMRDIYKQYSIPPNTPFGAVASNGGRY